MLVIMDELSSYCQQLNNVTMVQITGNLATVSYLFVNTQCMY